MQLDADEVKEFNEMEAKLKFYEENCDPQNPCQQYTQYQKRLEALEAALWKSETRTDSELAGLHSELIALKESIDCLLSEQKEIKKKVNELIEDKSALMAVAASSLASQHALRQRILVDKARRWVCKESGVAIPMGGVTFKLLKQNEGTIRASVKLSPEAWNTILYGMETRSTVAYEAFEAEIEESVMAAPLGKYRTGLHDLFTLVFGSEPQLRA